MNLNSILFYLKSGAPVDLSAYFVEEKIGGLKGNITAGTRGSLFINNSTGKFQELSTGCALYIKQDGNIIPLGTQVAYTGNQIIIDAYTSCIIPDYTPAYCLLLRQNKIKT